MSDPEAADPTLSLRDLPKDPVELDAWLTAHEVPYLALPPVEKIEAATAEFLSAVESWAAAKRTHALEPAERLLLAWVRKRLPDMRATLSDFKAFVVAEAPGHARWGLMHFVAHWSVRREPSVIRDAISLQMVLLMKVIEDQERDVRPLAVGLVKRIRALKTALNALRKELDRMAQVDGRSEFWTRLESRLSRIFGAAFGPEAVAELSAGMSDRFVPDRPTPLQAALSPLRKEWDDLLARTVDLSDRTLTAIQKSFLSETVVAASHAPTKRGLLRRIVELSRIGLSHADIATFEGKKPKAVAELLRRNRPKKPVSTQGP